jgi:hypothetical protein
MPRYFEGGVRGVGLIHGVGLAQPGTVNNGMHTVNDWLPTLLSAAAAAVADDPSAQHQLRLSADEPPFLLGDGIDNWKMFSRGVPSARTEMIHVTQAAGSVLQAEALRVDDMKLLWHPAGTDCSRTHPGWYPPPGKAWDYANFTVRCPRPPAQQPTMQDCSALKPCLFNISAVRYIAPQHRAIYRRCVTAPHEHELRMILMHSLLPHCAGSM